VLIAGLASVAGCAGSRSVPPLPSQQVKTPTEIAMEAIASQGASFTTMARVSHPANAKNGHASTSQKRYVRDLGGGIVLSVFSPCGALLSYREFRMFRGEPASIPTGVS
jgi:hypothetical protein